VFHDILYQTIETKVGNEYLVQTRLHEHLSIKIY